MNTIEIIKKACELGLAEGFELTTVIATNDAIKIPNSGALTINMLVRDKLAFPLFLDRICQGITKSDLPYLIIQNHFAIAIIDPKDHCSFVEFDYVDYSVDQARLAAITWIFERMEGGKDVPERFLSLEKAASINNLQVLVSEMKVAAEQWSKKR